MENPAASAREKPQRELKYLSQKIRLPASAAAAGNTLRWRPYPASASF
jgi:hypothetical protein